MGSNWAALFVFTPQTGWHAGDFFFFLFFTELQHASTLPSKQRLFCVCIPLFTCRSAAFTAFWSRACNICTAIKCLTKAEALQPAQFTHSINYASKNISPFLLPRGSCLWFEFQTGWLHLVAKNVIKHQRSFEAELSSVMK